MAVTVDGSSITFSDSSIQTRKPMKLLGEAINSGVTTSSPTSNSFTGIDGFNQYILVWDCVQYSGPSSSSLTLTEGTTSAAFSTKDASDLIITSSTTNTITRTSQAVGTTNFLTGFSYGSGFVKGRVTITKVRSMSSTLTQLWNMDVMGGNASLFLTNHKIGTTTTGSGGFGIGSMNLSLGYSHQVNIRLYGIE